jgi:hypothetical protein
MAKMFSFPHKDKWSKPDKTIADKLKQEGFGNDAIKTVTDRLRAYREKYLASGFDFSIGEEVELSPEAVKAIEAALRKMEEQICEFTSNILLERISVEIALLDYEPI